MGKLYYTIGEVASMLGEATSTLRYWEKEFRSLKPSKNERGDRRYTESDIAVLKRIQQLTRQEGYTLEGAREQLQRNHKEDGSTDRRVQLEHLLRQMRDELTEIEKQL